MGLLTSLLLLPVSAPLQGSLWVAKRITESVERERNSPAALREALREAEARLISGELSEDDYEAVETDLLERLRTSG
jgi:hypothetical protein